MKKILFPLVALAVLSARAQSYDYPYLVFQQTDGTTRSMAVTDLTLTFGDGLLYASTPDTRITLSLADLSKMYFSADPTAIRTPDRTPDHRDVEVYTLSGLHVGRYPDARQARTALQPGIYVMKHNGHVSKISVR